MTSFVYPSLDALSANASTMPSTNFPSEWFEKNPRAKPSVELPVMDCSLDQVRSTVKHFLLNNPSHRLDPDLVLLYFRKLADTMKARLEEDWTSFGTTIGKAGTEVGPLDIVDVKNRIAVKLKLEPSVAAGPEDDLWILMALAALYHISVSAAEDKGNFKDTREVVEQWETAGCKMSELDDFWKVNSMLTTCPSYTKMIAVFDMFLFKFPDHGLSAARKLTSASRFQGFAAYQSLSRLSKLINMDFIEIYKWLWTESLQKEYLSITRSGQELDQPHSYTPYYMVLQLSTVSQYSEDANPFLYVFTNTVAITLYFDQDAINAPMPEKSIPENVINNAIVMSYAFLRCEKRDSPLPEGPPKA